MKKGIIILMLALMLPAVNALITINDEYLKDAYNAGDEIKVSGFVYSLPESDGLFQLVAECGEKSFPSMPVQASFDQGQKFFPEEVETPVIKAMAEMEGTCHIEAQVILDKEVVDTAKSRSFEVSKALTSSFEKPEFRVQLGSPVHIKGSIFTLDGKWVNGQATIYFNDENSQYVIGETKVKDGVVEFEYVTSAMPAGKYSIDVLVRDFYGNAQMFEGVAEFLLINELYVFAKTKEEKVLPGESFEIFGEAKTILQEKVGEASVEIEFDSTKYTAGLEESKFSMEIDASDGIKSGKHEIFVSVKDRVGNSGSASTAIFVQPIISSLENEFEGKVSPGEPFEVESFVTDQGGDPIAATVHIEIFEPGEELVFSKKAQSGEKVIFQMPQFAAPGTWVLKAKAGGIQTEDEFAVNTVENLSVEIIGNKLVIRNIGNVKHRGKIEVDADGVFKSYELVKRKTIEVNESFEIDMEEEVPVGYYEIKTPNIQGSFIGSMSVKEGKERLSLDGTYSIFAMIGVILIVFLMGLKHDFRPRQHRNEPRNKLRKVKKAEEPPKPVYGRSEDADVEDFKQKVIDEVKRIEEREAKYPKKEEGKPAEGEGLFNMFG